MSPFPSATVTVSVSDGAQGETGSRATAYPRWTWSMSKKVVKDLGLIPVALLTYPDYVCSIPDLWIFVSFSERSHKSRFFVKYVYFNFYNEPIIYITYNIIYI